MPKPWRGVQALGNRFCQVRGWSVGLTSSPHLPPPYVELTPLSMMECFPHIKAQGVEVNSLPSMIDIYFARTKPTSSYIRQVRNDTLQSLSTPASPIYLSRKPVPSHPFLGEAHMHAYHSLNSASRTSSSSKIQTHEESCRTALRLRP